MLVGRWWVVRVESDGWKAGRKVRQDPKAETADWIAHLERGATMINGAAEMGMGREVVMTSEHTSSNA